MKIKCSVIKDILPLYVESIVSEDTKILVDSHLKECEECKKELEEMKTPEEIPIDINTNGFRNVKKKIYKEKFQVIILSVILTLVITILAINYLTAPAYIPYSNNIVNVIAEDNGFILVDFADEVSGYTIDKYLSEDGTGYIYHISTWNNIWSRYTKNKDLGTILLNSNGEKINSIYYYTDKNLTDGQGDVLIYGEKRNGGVITLPRLVLSYYLLIAIIISVICILILLILKKEKKSTKVMMKILFIPISYILAHLCIKGLNSKSYLTARDFSGILLISILIYFAIIISINLFNKIKYKK